LRDVTRTDDKGWKYRANISVRAKSINGVPLFLWADIDDAPRSHFVKKRPARAPFNRKRLFLARHEDGKTTTTRTLAKSRVRSCQILRRIRKSVKIVHGVKNALAYEAQFPWLAS
jgi:hypothetical protein